jgi:hypothetical protein
MLKLTISVSISISALLSIASIADARSIGLALTHYSLDRPKSYLIAEQSKSTTDNIPQEDLQGIHKSLSKLFGETNRGLAPVPVWSSIYYKYILGANTCYFIEAKSVQILSFSSTKAKVNVETDEQKYTVEIVQQHPTLLSFQKDNKSNSLTKRVQQINLEKINQKWRVRTFSGQLI